MSIITYYKAINELKIPLYKTHIHTKVEHICLTSDISKVEPINDLRSSIHRHVAFKLGAHDTSNHKVHLKGMNVPS